MAVVAHGADTDALLDRWCAAQTNLKSWSADVRQTRSLKVLAQPLVSTGRVWVAVPDRFRLEMGQPAITIALRQPDHLWLIYPRLKRAEKYPLNGTQAGPWKDALALLEASFPRSRADLESRFQVRAISQGESLVELTLAPKSQAARKFMTEIQVSLSPNDFAPRATELRFSDGSRMRSEFTHPLVNPPLASDLFTVSLPPDFVVVEPLRP
jgi:outer membrane lipoprotein-sorting protein